MPERFELERALREAGRRAAFPPTPDVALAVGERLRTEGVPRRGLGRRRGRLVIALAALAVAAGAALAIPPARSAILELLGLRGVTIERVDETPVFDAATGRRLGVPVGLAEARRAASFRLLVPREDDVRVTLDRRLPGTAVTFSWDGRRLLLTEFRGEATPFIEKSAGPGTRVELVPVHGSPGYWLAGVQHRVVFRDARGTVLESRAAGNVLLWERGEVTLRLEGARTKAEALAIAGTLRPAPV